MQGLVFSATWCPRSFGVQVTFTPLIPMDGNALLLLTSWRIWNLQRRHQKPKHFSCRRCKAITKYQILKKILYQPLFKMQSGFCIPGKEKKKKQFSSASTSLDQNALQPQERLHSSQCYTIRTWASHWGKKVPLLLRSTMVRELWFISKQQWLWLVPSLHHAEKAPQDDKAPMSVLVAI